MAKQPRGMVSAPKAQRAGAEALRKCIVPELWYVCVFDVVLISFYTWPYMFLVLAAFAFAVGAMLPAGFFAPAKKFSWLLWRTGPAGSSTRLAMLSTFVAFMLFRSNGVLSPFALAVAVIAMSFSYYSYGIMRRLPVHMDSQVFQVGVKKRHCPLNFYPDEASAQKSKGLARGGSPHVMSLNGLWTFHLAESVDQVLPQVHEVSFNTDGWGQIEVPSNWEFRDDQITGAIYTNVVYPWFHSHAPPRVPHKNPTGVYRRSVSIPQSWVRLQHRVSIWFHGVSSAMHVFFNGVEVGYAQDSFMGAEFDVTNLIYPNGEDNVLVVIVMRWSDGSYLEDQDHWWLSGIFRSVEVIAMPSSHMCDIRTSTQLHGLSNGRADRATLTVQVAVENGLPDANLSAKLYDGDTVVAANSVTIEGEEASESRFLASAATLLTLSLDVSEPRLWSAEEPALYNLVLGLDKGAREPAQYEALRVGLRTVRIVDSTLLVNGEVVLIKGVNRHEHSPKFGKAVERDPALLLNDLALLKRCNFNAVRTSHYPNILEFYDACDEKGFYVVDEANVESHGDVPKPLHWIIPQAPLPMSRFGHDPRWRNCLLARILGPVQRDHNHACIIIWSLGNEAGSGTTFDDAYAALKKWDLQQRPVQYECDGSPRTCSDIVCPMYMGVKDCEKYAESNEDRPLILCEYSHAMSNSNGNLDLYWKAFRTHKKLQGGFIWDFVDQGLPLTKNGKQCWGYGGDFGDCVENRGDLQFCINGLVWPDRTPHPGMYEAAALQQPVQFLLKSADIFEDQWLCSIDIQSEHCFITLTADNCKFLWELAVADRDDVVQQGVWSLSLPPQQSISQKLRLPVRPGVAWLRLRVELATDQWWAKAGHVVAHSSFELPQLQAKQVSSDVVAGQWTPCLHGGNGGNELHTFEAEGHLLGFSAGTGLLDNWKMHGRDMVVRGPELCLYRAPTDNDRGGSDNNMMTQKYPALLRKRLLSIIDKVAGSAVLSYAFYWHKAGLDTCVPVDGSVRPVGGKVLCSYALRAKHDLVGVRSQYAVHGNGKASIITSFDMKQPLPPLARIGLRLALSPDLSNVVWAGRGPHENYPDRLRSADWGVYRSSIDDLHVPYIVPQENGARMARWVAFVDQDGTGVVFSAEQPFFFSASRFSLEELSLARHTSDLSGRGPIYLHLDAKIMGVGGDVSWMPCVYDDYLLKPENTTFEFQVYSCRNTGPSLDDLRAELL